MKTLCLGNLLKKYLKLLLVFSELTREAPFIQNAVSKIQIASFGSLAVEIISRSLFLKVNVPIGKQPILASKLNFEFTDCCQCVSFKMILGHRKGFF